MVRLPLIIAALLLASLAAGAVEKPHVPIPRAKPAGMAKPPESPPWPDAGTDWPAPEVAAERAVCSALLAGLDVAWTPLVPLGVKDGCGAPAPVEIAEIAGVALDPPATVTCPLAAHLHHWITQTVQPAARSDLKTTVQTIHTASSYVCRLRNNQKNGKLSEHARANALDMSGFSFARPKDVTVKDGWGGFVQRIGLSPGGAFLEHIHSGACSDFTTVLGPGSDPYHGNHFHVDAMARGNGYRICQ